MIKIDKGIAPKCLTSDKVKLAYDKMQAFYSSLNREQRRYKFPFNRDIDREIKEELHEEFHGKCGYCEIKILSPEYGTIDRFRPHNGVRDNNNYYKDLYWWLTFDWCNLVYSCKLCNQYKASYFPISGVRALNKNANLTNEEHLILDPCIDEPNEHFFYNYDGRIQSKTKKGGQTIDLLRLNRTNLVEERQKTKGKIKDILDSINQHGITSISRDDLMNIHQIYNNENDYIEFSGYRKWILLDELGNNPLLRKLLNIDDYEQKTSTLNAQNQSEKKEGIDPKLIINDYFPIEYIQIQNFKSIDNIRINFKEDDLDGKSWLFLLGENGVGKSSILQAIAVGLKADGKIVKSLIPRLIKKSKQKTIIDLKARNSKTIIRTILTRKDSSIQQDGEFDSFLIGYGSLRLSVDEAEDNSKKNIKGISYENLFKPTIPLNDITKWLKLIHTENPDFFDRIAYSIKQLLPHDFLDNELTVQKGEIMFKNSEKLFSELSDGFKSTITLAVDIMMKLSASNADMDKMTGVVLIDELGNQLHPRWQMRVVTQLRTVFPNINFIISTHHPLCLRGSENEEILLLKNINNEVVPITELPNPSSMRVDQILASDFFGLSSLVDPEIEANFNRYYELLAKNENVTSKEKEEIDQLRDQLRNKQQLGSSLREELMYAVIDKLLAQKIIYNKNPLDRGALKEEVVKRVKEVWKTLNIGSND